MVLDGICYSAVHFCRVILCVWRSPFVVSLFLASTLYEYFRLRTSFGVLCVSSSCCAIIIRPLNQLFKTLSPSLWRGCINTLVFSTSKLRQHTKEGERGCPPRAMTPFPSKKKMGLTSPRWQMLIDILKKYSKDSYKK